MHKEILSQDQIELLPLIKKFSDTFYLVGGTAIALHLGHRRSIDFDLFTKDDFDNKLIRTRIKRNRFTVDRELRDQVSQFTIIINNTHMTFFQFIYEIDLGDKLDSIIRMPDLLTLGAMKVFALGQRAKWKDYVDLYFIFKKYSLVEVSAKAKQLFGNEYNERIIKEQLAYFDDINYSQPVEWMHGFEVGDEEIKKYLTEVSLER